MSGMTKIISGLLNQTAVYWANPQADGTGGHTFDTPIEVAVRWQMKQELFTTLNGQEKTSIAVVYANQDFVVGGYLFLGTLADLSSGEEADPQIVTTAYEIRAYGKSPDLGATRFLRKVWL